MSVWFSCNINLTTSHIYMCVAVWYAMIKNGEGWDPIHQFRYTTFWYMSLYTFSFHNSILFLLQLFWKVGHTLKYTLIELQYIVKLVYKSHSREPENVAFMNRRTLYTSKHYMHYSVMGNMRLSFIDNDLLDRGAL